jgi:hypothetical protein
VPKVSKVHRVPKVHKVSKVPRVWSELKFGVSGVNAKSVKREKNM